MSGLEGMDDLEVVGDEEEVDISSLKRSTEDARSSSLSILS